MTFFEQLKDAVDSNNYTDDQVRNASKQQVASLLGVDVSCIRDGVLKRVKSKLIKDRALTKHQAFVSGLKDQFDGGVRQWLEQNHPSHKIINDARQGSITVISDYAEPEEE